MGACLERRAEAAMMVEGLVTGRIPGRCAEPGLAMLVFLCAECDRCRTSGRLPFRLSIVLAADECPILL